MTKQHRVTVVLYLLLRDSLLEKEPAEVEGETDNAKIAKHLSPKCDDLTSVVWVFFYFSI